MRSVLWISLVVVIAPATFADVTVGGNRPVTVRVPATYDPAVPAPLLILLHGYGNTPEYIEPYMRFLPLTEERGILFAAPRGNAESAGGNIFWDGTDACCNFTGIPVDDSGYLRGVIAEIEGLLNVDRNRIYLVGHSNGGFMSYRMACDHSEVIAAICSLAGATFADPARCDAISPVHVLQVHGTADGTILYNDGGSINGVSYPGAVSTAEQWAAKNGCTVEPERLDDLLDLDAGIAGPDTRIDRYAAGCAAGGAVELWSVEGGSHGPNWRASGSSTHFAANVLDWLLAHPKQEGPSASFTVGPDIGPVPLEVSFDGSASTAPEGTTLAEYRWLFGNGTGGEGVAGTYTYTVPGRYASSLQVATADGRWSRKVEHLVKALWPAGDTLPWVQATIGEPAFPGTARRDEASGDLLLCAGGRAALAAVTSDEWLFLHQESAADFRLTARVSDLEGGGTNARVGLAFRESLAPNSRFAGVFLIRSSVGDRLLFGYRTSLAGIFRSHAAVVSGTTWLRLERRGDLFTGLSSADGTEWKLVQEQTLPGLPPTLLAGITATGSDVTPAGSFVAFRARVSGLALAPLAPGFRRGDANDDAKVDISDGLRILNHLFQGAQAPACADAADANDSGGGALDLSDAVAIFEFLFMGTRPSLPPPGHTTCGADPTEDALGCAASQGCAA
jgi:polyhydroxybutyrate depolymerase